MRFKMDLVKHLGTLTFNTSTTLSDLEGVPNAKSYFPAWRHHVVNYTMETQDMASWGVGKLASQSASKTSSHGVSRLLQYRANMKRKILFEKKGKRGLRQGNWRCCFKLEKRGRLFSRCTDKTGSFCCWQEAGALLSPARTSAGSYQSGVDCLVHQDWWLQIISWCV